MVQIADFGLSRVMVETSISTGTYGTVTHSALFYSCSLACAYAFSSNDAQSLRW